MRTIHSILIASALAAGASCAEAQNVSVTGVISGQVVPGVYGQVVFGNAPPPPVVYQQPVVVAPPPVVYGAPPMEPIYLHVPPGHAKHCHEYHACNRPVYFVRSEEYEPGFDRDRWEREHGHGHGHEHGHGHGHDEDHGDHDRGDRDHDR